MRAIVFLACVACSQSTRVSPSYATEAGAANTATDRLLTRSADLSIHRDDPESGPAAVTSMAKQLHGWVQLQSTQSATVRIPAPQLDAFLVDLAKLGEVYEKHVQAEDVTDAVRDLRIRLDNLEKSRGRYLALLDRAQSVADATAVERELERVTTEIERLQAQLATNEKRVEYAAVSVAFSRKAHPGPVGWVFYGLFRAVGWLFVHD